MGEGIFLGVIGSVIAAVLLIFAVSFGDEVLRDQVANERAIYVKNVEYRCKAVKE